MTVDTISDALTRIGSIQQQVQWLHSGTLSTRAATPEAQIQALQNPGWSSVGHPNLESLHGEMVG